MCVASTYSPPPRWPADDAAADGPPAATAPPHPTPPHTHTLPPPPSQKVRITAEDAEDGFKPTAGRIDELHFRPTPDVWGYFSVKSGGGIHEFSDSQVRACVCVRACMCACGSS